MLPRYFHVHPRFEHRDTVSQATRLAARMSVMYFLNGKYMTEELAMRDAAGDPAALELLRVQRGRLADRLRPPWWYLTGLAIMWALVFACPFSLAVTWGPASGPSSLPRWWWPCRCSGAWTRVTGMKMGVPELSALPARAVPRGIAMVVVSLGRPR